MAYHRFLLLLAVMVAFVMVETQSPEPNSNTTTTERPLVSIIYMPEPKGRGTWGILFSSTATFAFCIWTAMHPNVLHNRPQETRTLYKGVWMVLSIIVPEGILICAFRQWWTAHKLDQWWREHFKKEYGEYKSLSERHGSCTSKSRCKPCQQHQEVEDYLGMDGAFFVVMGGTMMGETADGDWKILTPEEFREKIESQGHFTSSYTRDGDMLKEVRHLFDKEEMLDKGKASSIAKLLSSFQALWLLVQSIARWQAKLPITLLEIHVLIQVFFTFILIACWWQKPLDVNEPIEILKTIQRRGAIPDKPAFDLVKVGAHACYDIISCLGTVTEGQQTQAVATSEKTPSEAIEIAQLPENRRWRSNPWMLFGEGVLVSLSGALHALAWNVHFPSRTEMWLWRSSSLGICAFPLYIVVVAYFTAYDADLVAAMEEIKNGTARVSGRPLNWFWFVPWCVVRVVRVACGRTTGMGWIFHYCMIWSCFIALYFYMLCILFLTVEAYINLREPISGVFDTPRWSDFWPHL